MRHRISGRGVLTNPAVLWCLFGAVHMVDRAFVGPSWWFGVAGWLCAWCVGRVARAVRTRGSRVCLSFSRRFGRSFSWSVVRLPASHQPVSQSISQSFSAAPYITLLHYSLTLLSYITLFTSPRLPSRQVHVLAHAELASSLTSLSSPHLAYPLGRYACSLMLSSLPLLHYSLHLTSLTLSAGARARSC